MSKADVLLVDASEDQLIEALEDINPFWEDDYAVPRDLSSLDDSEVIDELENRGYTVSSISDNELFYEQIYQKIINNESYENELHAFLKNALGKAL